MRLTYGRGRLVPTVVLEPETALRVYLRTWPSLSPREHEYGEWTGIIIDGSDHIKSLEPKEVDE